MRSGVVDQALHVETARIATSSLAAVAVLQAVAAARSSGPRSTANAIGAMVCAIAYVHYQWMLRASSVSGLFDIRYSDWALTCPLLLLETFAITGQHFDVRGSARILAAVFLVWTMLALGRAARPSGGSLRWQPFVGSVVAFLLVVYLTVVGCRKYAWVAWLVFALWALYPIAFLVESHMSFNLLDVLSKSAIGVCIVLLGSTD